MGFKLNADELITTLNHSNFPAILLIEDGLRDMEPYRFIREQLKDLNIDLMTCLGVGVLQQVFERRLQIVKPYTMFLKDKDLLVYESTLPNSEIIYTTGYSIENDVYYGTDIEALLDEDERSNHNLAKQTFIQWYAYRIHQRQLDGTTAFARLPESILTETYNIKVEHQPTPEQLEASQERYNEILSNYTTLLRGHSLFNLLLIFLNTDGRNPTYSEKELMTHCVQQLNPPLLINLINSIRERYNQRNS